MKFLPDSPKKKILSFVIILISLGGIIYLNFFMGKSSSRPVNKLPSAAMPNANPTQTAAAPLPYGTKIDDAILDSQSFKALKFFPRLTVSDSELGKTDLFSR